MVDETVNRAHFRIYLLVVKWCNEQLYSFRQIPKWVNADRAQYVPSSSGPITIVVMTLLTLENVQPQRIYNRMIFVYGEQGHNHHGDQAAWRPHMMCSICGRRFATNRFEVRGGRGWAHSAAISYRFWAISLAPKTFPPVRPTRDTMANTALEAAAPSSYATVTRWEAEFHPGRTSFKDDPWAGRPSDAVCEDKVITTMVIRPLDDPTWCAQSVVADLRPFCLGGRGDWDELIRFLLGPHWHIWSISYRFLVI